MKNGHMTSKDHRISAEVKRRLPTRRRRHLSQVLVTPVKLGGLGLKLDRNPAATGVKAENLPSSSSRRVRDTPADILGEMCKGLQVLESRDHTIERDGSIIPKGMQISYTKSRVLT